MTEWFGDLLSLCFDPSLGLPETIPLFQPLQTSSMVWPTLRYPNVNSEPLNKLLQLYPVHMEVARMVNTLGANLQFAGM